MALLKPRVLAVVGPTASGKTQWAVQLAKSFRTVVISFDSRQLYKEMTIGTAAPTSLEMDGVPHYFIQSHSIHHPLSAGVYSSEVDELLSKLSEKYDTVILVGGSGLYLQAVLFGFDEMPEVSESIRNTLNAEYKKNGLAWLQEQVAAKDPGYYEEVDRANPQRLIRALEVMEASGKPFSFYRKKAARPARYPYQLLGLELPREELNQRINERVINMMANGLVEEVQSLLSYRLQAPLQTVGYQEVFDLLDGKINEADCLASIQQNTRKYAKRQLTWFKRIPEVTWFQSNVDGDRIRTFAKDWIITSLP